MVTLRVLLAANLMSMMAPVVVWAQGVRPSEVQLWDVIEMEDGTVWRGVIIEHVPGSTYRIVLESGRVVVVDISQVARVTREPNPRSSTTAGPSWIPPLAAPGLRFSMLAGAAVPTENRDYYDGGSLRLDAGPTVSARLGYEAIAGATGLTPAFFFEYTRLGVDDAPVHIIHTGLQLRVAMHLGRFVPYAAIGFGADVAGFDAEEIGECGHANTRCRRGRGFGMHFGFGSDLLLSERFALGLQFTIHPGITNLIDIDHLSPYSGEWYDDYGTTEIGYFALGLSASLY